jgi:hypothetical protein
MLSGGLRRLLAMSAPAEIQAMFGAPGEPVPTVRVKDIRAAWKVSRDAAARRPGGITAIDIRFIERACSPGADVRAVWWRGVRFKMFDMLLLRNLLSGSVARPLREIAFVIFARVPMKWWALGENYRGLF